jgi:hypothetical protein
MTDVAQEWVSMENIPDTATPKAPEIYYDTGTKDYWTLNSRSEWIRLAESGIKRLLKQKGFWAKRREGEPLSQLDECILGIQQKSDVAYAGPLAGHPKGIVDVGNQRVLVTSSPKLIEAAQGDFPVLRKIMDNMFGQEQLPYVKGWLKTGFEALRDGNMRPGQVLVLAGEANSGKSFFQNLVTHILGGRVAKPYRYMSGGTDFNRELFGCEHLAIEDDVASTDIRSRRQFGARIKEFTVNEVQSCHGKNREAISLRPFWRVTVSVNDEPENLTILPPFDESLADKMILLKVARHDMPVPSFTNEERRRFMETVLKELPAFLWDLTHWEIPSDLRSGRFGIRHFHHPELLESVEQLAPEVKLLALIDRVLSGVFSGTAEELEEQLVNAPGIRNVLTWPAAAGVYLGRLAKKHPERVLQKRTGARRGWEILPAPGSGDGVTPGSDKPRIVLSFKKP